VRSSRQGRGGPRPNSGGKREGAGRKRVGNVHLYVRLPADVIEAATQLALELSADECRPVPRQEVYRRILAGTLPRMRVDGSGPLSRDRLTITAVQLDRALWVQGRNIVSRDAAVRALLFERPPEIAREGIRDSSHDAARPKRRDHRPVESEQ
jgi:hypothetical protein